MSLRFCFVALLCAAGCNAPDPPGSTGGTNQEPGSCGRGVLVVSTDESFASTNTSLVGFDGKILSSSFVSSAGTVNLSSKLSGDVSVPTALTNGADLVLIDQKVGVLTFADVKSAAVSRQVLIGSGLNPHDYLSLSPDRALVTRYDRSQTGQGSDIVALNPQTGELGEAISLATAMSDADPKYLPTPWHLLRSGNDVVVTLNAEIGAHTESTDARIVLLDGATSTIKGALTLSGLHECNGIAASPDGKTFAVACSGSFLGSNASDPAESAVVLVDAAAPLGEIRRFPTIANAPFGFGIAWPSSHTLLVTTLGALDSTGQSVVRKDSLVELDVDSGATRPVLESAASAFVLRDARCAAACNVCFATDHERGVLHRFDVSATGELAAPTQISVDPQIGLPPWMLGQF